MSSLLFLLDDLLPAFGALILSLLWGGFCQAVGLMRRADKDLGDLWSRSLVVSFIVGLCSFLLGGMAWAMNPPLTSTNSISPNWYASGNHLWADLLSVSDPKAFWALLALGWLAWAGGVGLLALFPSKRPSGAWLAGRLCERGSRRWVLVFALPMGLVLAGGALHLDHPGQLDAVPVLPWTAVLTALVSLCFLAFSEGQEYAVEADSRVQSEVLRPGLDHWPQAMAALGVAVQPIVTWDKGSGGREARPGPLTDALANLNARQVAPEIAESVGMLLSHRLDDKTRAALVQAADDCGQLEGLAAAARVLGERQHELTLVVTPRPDLAVIARLRELLGHDFVYAPGPGSTLDPGRAVVLVVDAEQLGQSVLPRLTASGLCGRLGLVAWWDVHVYSGVLAANVWAISRRLHRLVRARGRRDVRALAFARREEHGGAQQRRFIQQVLPYIFPKDLVVEVPLQFARSVHLYRLGSHEAFVQGGPHDRVANKDRYPAAVAAYASALTAWPSRLDSSGSLPDDVVQDFLRLNVGGATMKEALVPTSAEAGARILDLPDEEALSLVDRVAQGGRLYDANMPHHVALVSPENPYVAWLLRRLQDSDEAMPVMSESRLLVNSPGNRGIVRRHLAQALGELADTRQGLSQAMQWDWVVVAQTLARIDDRHKLRQREVRWLDDKGQLQIDREYESLQAPAPMNLPLDTVGTELVSVVDVTSAADLGVRLRIDRERLPIVGYPGCVFMSGGHRYRISDWSQGPHGQFPDRLVCVAEGKHGSTHRVASGRLGDVKAIGPAVHIGHDGQGKTFVRWQAVMTYTEQVKGVIRLDSDLTRGTRLPGIETGFSPLQTTFETSGVVLHFPHRPDRTQLDSVAAALRLCLPVHIGVARDALAVIPVTNEKLEDTDVCGLALIDLYPDGMGMVDAFAQNHQALVDILERCLEWLVACPCQSPTGCGECLQGPLALALSPYRTHSRQPAISLLQRLLPHRHPDSY